MEKLIFGALTAFLIFFAVDYMILKEEPVKRIEKTTLNIKTIETAPWDKSPSNESFKNNVVKNSQANKHTDKKKSPLRVKIIKRGQIEIPEDIKDEFKRSGGGFGNTSKKLQAWLKTIPDEAYTDEW